METPDGEPAREQIAELERRLAAKDRTIEILMTRVEGALASRSNAFALFEQNITLERLVQDRTQELFERGEQLRHALAELKQTQAELLHAHKLEAIGSLAAGVAHEINTPVQFVGDNVTFLRRAFGHLANVAVAARALLGAPAEAQPRPEVAEVLRAVKRAKLDFLLREVPAALEQAGEGLQRIAHIVGAMKEFSHPSKGEKEPVDLARAIETTVTIARNEWKYVAEVETEFDPDLPHVPALRDDLNQVLLNLVVNAAHAISEVTDAGAKGKGTIWVTTRREGEWAVVEVSDTGIGIPDHIVGRVFDPFFTTKPVGKGTGQGLAIVHDIVTRKHGGRIEVRSEVGKGATFAVHLPLDGMAH
jgi:signal transduction histidine kinase